MLNGKMDEQGMIFTNLTRNWTFDPKILSFRISTTKTNMKI